MEYIVPKCFSQVAEVVKDLFSFSIHTKLSPCNPTNNNQEMMFNAAKISLVLGLLVMVVVEATEKEGDSMANTMPCIKPKMDCDPHYTSPFKSRIGDKIIGGEVAEPGTTPWLASLQDLQYSPPVHFCGATLITFLWVITSASCVDGYLEPYDSLQVVLGEYDMMNDDGWERTRGVSTVTPHPRFDPITYANDVALIRMHNFVFYNERIAPLPLPNAHRYLKNGSRGFYGCRIHGKAVVDYKWPDTSPSLYYIAGWGRTAEISQMSEVVMEARVPLVSDQECQQAYSDTYSESYLCAGNYSHGGVDPCTGDWGGPLVSPWGYLRGVSSWANGCGRPGYPAVYTDIFTAMNWICSVID